MQDHKTVKALFNAFAKLGDDDDATEQKALLAEKICNELSVHAQIEEEIFYPACREALDAADLDTAALGVELMARKQELMAEFGMDADEVQEQAPPAKRTVKKPAPGARK